MIREQLDVPAALAKRGQAQGEHGQSVIEVLAESMLADGGRQILVARAHHPDVHRVAPRAPETADRTVLESLEQLSLERCRQQPDLVQEHRAAIGRLQQALLRLTRFAEGAALETEHLGLEQRLGDRGAVQIHEEALSSWTMPVQGPRQQPLAGAGLAVDEDRRHPLALTPALEQRGDLLAERRDLATLPQQLGHGRHIGAILAPVDPVRRPFDRSALSPSRARPQVPPRSHRARSRGPRPDRDTHSTMTACPSSTPSSPAPSRAALLREPCVPAAIRRLCAYCANEQCAHP